jgi:hypothetical protein
VHSGRAQLSPNGARKTGTSEVPFNTRSHAVQPVKTSDYRHASSLFQSRKSHSFQCAPPEICLAENAGIMCDMVALSRRKPCSGRIVYRGSEYARRKTFRYEAKCSSAKSPTKCATLESAHGSRRETLGLCPREAIPEPWRSFLNVLDRIATSAVRLDCIGGASGIIHGLFANKCRLRTQIAYGMEELR